MANSAFKSVPIDEALEATKYGKFNYFLNCVSGFIMFNVMIESTGISNILPITKCDLDMTYQQKGILSAVGFLGIISSSHLWGFLADTTGRKKIIGHTLIIGYLISVASSFSPNYLTLLVLRFANGFVLSGGSAIIYAYHSEFHCNRIRNRAIMTAAIISVAVALGYPLMAWTVINRTWSLNIPLLGIVYKPWRLYVAVCGLLGFISGLCFLWLPESPKYLLSVGKGKDAVAVLKRIYSINTGNKMDSFEITSVIPSIDEEGQRLKVDGEKANGVRFLMRTVWNQTAPLFMREHYRKTVLLCFVQFWIFFTAHGVYMWFPHLLDSVMQFTKKLPNERHQICEIFYIMERDNSTAVLEQDCIQTLETSTFQHMLALEIFYMLISVCVGYLTGKIGRNCTLFSVLLVCGLCGVGSAIIDIPNIAAYCLVILLICGLANGVVNAIAVDIYPTHLRAMAVCISLMMGRIGAVTGTNVVGALIEQYCQTALLLASIFILIVGLLAFLIPKGIELKKTDDTIENA